MHWVDGPPWAGLSASCEWQARVRGAAVRQVRDEGVDKACEDGKQDQPREGEGQMSQSTASLGTERSWNSPGQALCPKPPLSPLPGALSGLQAPLSTGSPSADVPASVSSRSVTRPLSRPAGACTQGGATGSRRPGSFRKPMHSLDLAQAMLRCRV